MATTLGDILDYNDYVKGAKDKKKVLEEKSAKPAADATGTVTGKSNSFYQDFVKSTEAPETPEQRAKREKRERSAKIIAGVGDMITSISNLVGTYNGAQSAYNPKEGLSAKMQERFDKMDAARKARDKQWYGLAQNAKRLDAMIADREERRRLSEERDMEQTRIANEKAEIARARQAFLKEKDDYQREHKLGPYAPKSSGRSGGVGEFTTTTTDKNGNVVKVVSRRRGASGKEKSSKQRRGYMLPSNNNQTQKSGSLLPQKNKK